MGGFEAWGGDRVNDVWHSRTARHGLRPRWAAFGRARERFAATVYNNSIWVMGGSDGSFRHNDVWYSPDGTAWNQVTTPGRKWSARERLAATTLNGRIWVMGGYDGREPQERRLVLVQRRSHVGFDGGYRQHLVAKGAFRANTVQ